MKPFSFVSEPLGAVATWLLHRTLPFPGLAAGWPCGCSGGRGPGAGMCGAGCQEAAAGVTHSDEHMDVRGAARAGVATTV